MARPPLDIDEEQVAKLAAINCSYEEMAAVLGCNPSTLTRRFAQAIEKGRSHGRMSLKRKQYEVAMGGNVTMLIWLGKQLLGQTDKVEQKIETLSQMSDDELLLKAREAMKVLEAPKTEPNPPRTPRTDTYEDDA